jgi:DNA-binding HxlR family transcriptional regulator
MQCVCPTDKCSPDDRVELTERELSVCTMISTSSEPVAFTVLKRSSDLHQEILSRVVRRLVIHGLVQKVDGKYQGNCDC